MNDQLHDQRGPALRVPDAVLGGERQPGQPGRERRTSRPSRPSSPARSGPYTGAFPTSAVDAGPQQPRAAHGRRLAA
ncbi:MAG: hypothetical protein MZV63_23810 [Marinilabiliales bacterium]|nr:hypothetical protein [Marinilabiliales bacterium]